MRPSADQQTDATRSPSARPARRPHQWVPAAAALFAAGWGVNQFAPLAIVYRTRAHWSALSVSAMFSTYLLGIVPGLLLGVWGTRRRGRRVVRPALGVLALASVILALAPLSAVAAYAGRLTAGVAAGIIFTVGAAWVSELSLRPWGPHADPARGARRATLAAGGGLVAGALASGILAQWLPEPMVLPCLAHVLLTLVVLCAVRRVPETAGPAAGRPTHRVRAVGAAVVRHPRFWRVVLPSAPAVFGAATVAYVVLPGLVADRLADRTPLFSGMVTALTFAAGIAAQPLARRLDRADSARALLVSLATVTAGLLTAAAAVARDSALGVLPAAALLGAGYGMTLSAGLLEIGRLAPPTGRSAAHHLFHGATYPGLLTPLLLTTAAGAAPYPVLLEALSVLSALSLVFTVVYSRRHLP